MYLVVDLEDCSPNTRNISAPTHSTAATACCCTPLSSKSPNQLLGKIILLQAQDLSAETTQAAGSQAPSRGWAGTTGLSPASLPTKVLILRPVSSKLTGGNSVDFCG